MVNHIQLFSLTLGAAVTQVFELPSWVTPAVAFNNTISLPLLLIQSLNATGILSSILMGSNDSTSDAVNMLVSLFIFNGFLMERLVLLISQHSIGNLQH